MRIKALDPSACKPVLAKYGDACRAPLATDIEPTELPILRDPFLEAVANFRDSLAGEESVLVGQDLAEIIELQGDHTSELALAGLEQCHNHLQKKLKFQWASAGTVLVGGVASISQLNSNPWMALAGMAVTGLVGGGLILATKTQANKAKEAKALVGRMGQYERAFDEAHHQFGRELRLTQMAEAEVARLETSDNDLEVAFEESGLAVGEQFVARHAG